jgi:putative intracellular protease/amidase
MAEIIERSNPDSPPLGYNRQRSGPPDPRGPNQLGKYRITGRLGQGGMGAVYEAEDTLQQRTVAVKVLPTVVSTNPLALRRFLLEAKAAGRLSHPNVVAMYEVDHCAGAYYIAMELVRGGSAQDLLKARGRLPWPEATQIVADACRGLAAAHAAGMIHRDIKPANIMCSTAGAVKLADFGLVKQTDQDTTSLTNAGRVIGTPSYMSPEQCNTRPIEFRCDIYALGATYYALLTGRPPFVGSGPLDVMFAHCHHPIPDPRDCDPTIPEACAAIIRRALAKDPAGRFASAAQMRAALEALDPTTTRPSTDLPRAWSGTGWGARRRFHIAALLMLVLLLGTGLTCYLGTGPGSTKELAKAPAPRSPHVVFILAQKDNVNADYEPVRKILESKGIKVSIATPGRVPAAMRTGPDVRADLALQDVNGSNYDAIVFGGGGSVPEFGDRGRFRDNARNVIGQALDSKKYVSGICTGTQVLAEAGVLQGKQRASGSTQARTDGLIITGLNFGSAKAFADELVKALLPGK